jgi:hypothetical protein
MNKVKIEITYEYETASQFEKALSIAKRLGASARSNARTWNLKSETKISSTKDHTAV